jgi:hypothetical protein
LYPKDITDKILQFENGEMDDSELIDFFQEITDSGLVWKLQGSYGRLAHHLLEEGRIHKAKEKHL